MDLGLTQQYFVIHTYDEYQNKLDNMNKQQVLKEGTALEILICELELKNIEPFIFSYDMVMEHLYYIRTMINKKYFELMLFETE